MLKLTLYEKLNIGGPFTIEEISFTFKNMKYDKVQDLMVLLQNL